MFEKLYELFGLFSAPTYAHCVYMIGHKAEGNDDGLSLP